MRRTWCCMIIVLFAAWACLAGQALAFNAEHVKQLNGTNKCPGCDLSKANLANIDFYGANLQGANLQGANLSGAVFADANLNEANLTGATTNKDTSFSGAKLSNATWMDGKKCGNNSIGKCK